MKRFTILFSAMLITCFVFGQTFQANHKILKTNNSSTSSTKAVVDTLKWCAEAIGTGIGLDAPATLGMAAQFIAADLTAVNGDYITVIRVNINDAAVVTSGKVGIITGDLAGTPVVAYEQAATFVAGWNNIMLTVPYLISSTTPFSIACEVVVTGGFPLGYDAGPANANTQADWISTGGLASGWDHAAAFGLSYNSMVMGVVDDNPATIAMSAAPTDVYFIGYVGAGATASETVVVQAVGLTSSISVTATAGFEVSSNNTTFAATATLPNTGGNLYARFIPGTVFGQTTGTATLTSTGATDVVVNLIGLTYDCQGAIAAPYTEDFYTSEKAGCWTVTDVNADGNTFMLYYSDGVGTLPDLVYIYPYHGTNAAEDWLISPLLTIPTNPVSSFEYWVAGATYPEAYEVYVITGSPANYATGTQIVTTQTVSNETAAVQTLSLTAYAGQDVYIGIKCVSDANMYLLYIDNFILDIGSSVENSNVNTLAVYPNPANDVVFVSEVSNITVVNMLGQVVASVENAGQINVSALPAGNYIVKVQNANQNSVKNITIVR